MRVFPLSRRLRPNFTIAAVVSMALVACSPAQQAPIQATLDRGMVVSTSTFASDAGAEVLRNGGNAVDAAIATGFALAVTSPSNGNIGGGGFMIIRFPDGTSTALDFREKAPLASFPEMWLDENGEYDRNLHHRGALSVGVPGTVAGFALAHEKYGTGDWSAVVEPAVKLATEGWTLPEGLARSLNSRTTRENALPGVVAGYSKDGVPWEAGETIVLPILGRTLTKIRDEGRDAFYRGEVAQLIVDEMGRGNGIITLEDLERYQAIEREPIRGTFRDYEIMTMPPPSSGGIAILEMLNIVEGFDLKAMGHYSAEYLHHTTEAARRAYRDRAVAIADTDFFPVPVARLTSKEYAVELRETIDSDRASVSHAEDILDFKESDETTHYSVVDENGMAVSVTFTLEGGYGSGIVVEGGGFFLNNEMGDFNAGPGITTATGLIGTDANLARPEQRMLSSMSPTIIAKDGQLVAVIGSPGGRTIINTVFHLALSIMEFEMDIESAVAAKRSNHQWLPDQMSVEADTPDEVVAQLEAMGHTVRVGRGQGQAHSIGVTSDGHVVGVPDPRSGATAGASHSSGDLRPDPV